MQSQGLLPRTVFRSLLRSSRMGRAPEIFGEFGTTLMAHDLDGGDESASMPPSSARDVRRLLKHAFRAAGSEAEAGGTEAAAAANEIMFSALRRANDLSAVAFPNFDADGLFPDNLPIFDFSGSAVLPQERSTFNFFEERYRELAREITHETSGTGFFLLRLAHYASS